MYGWGQYMNFQYLVRNKTNLSPATTRPNSGSPSGGKKLRARKKKRETGRNRLKNILSKVSPPNYRKPTFSSGSENCASTPREFICIFYIVIYHSRASGAISGLPQKPLLFFFLQGPPRQNKSTAS